MRRALGLSVQPASAPDRRGVSPEVAGHSPAHRRHFSRDGEVPVTVVHHDDGPGTNKLEAARQALGEQRAARERAEQLLGEARATVHDLQTKLVHEQMARDDAVRRAEEKCQAVQDALQCAQEELATERAARRQIEQERDDANLAHQQAEERLRAVMADRQNADRPANAKSSLAIGPSSDSDKVNVRRRRRQAKASQSDSEFVEWWKPGWRDRFR